MDPEQSEISERDQLWASLRSLLPDIEVLAAGKFDFSERQQQIVTILARIIKSELDFRSRTAAID
jgi:hypothetical protein